MLSKLAEHGTNEHPSKKARINDASAEDEADAEETAMLRFQQARPLVPEACRSRRQRVVR